MATGETRQQSGDEVPRKKYGNWLDGQALSYSDWMCWVHLLICQCPGVVVGLLFFLGCATSEGKAIGERLLKFSGFGLIIAICIILLRILAG